MTDIECQTGIREDLGTRISGIREDLGIRISGIREDLGTRQMTEIMISGMPAGWTRVSEHLGSCVLERRRGGINSRGFCREFRFDFEGFQFLGLVNFLVLPRPERQLARLASPRTSDLVFWSDGEAG